MSSDACRDFRGDLAVRALGRTDPDRDAALDAHLDGCAACRAELADTRSVATALGHADPAHVSAEVEAPPELSARIFEAVGAGEASRAKRTRAVVAAASALVVAAAVVAGLVFWRGDADGGQRIELAGEEASGTAELVARSWGTAVALEVTGLDDGEVYWLWLTGEDGKRVAAGTMTGTGGSVEAVLASAIPFEDARRIWMTDEDDAVVLDAMIDET